MKERQLEIAEIFHREYQNFLRYLRKRVTDWHQMDLEDMIEDLMLNLFNKADITVGIENLTAYIYQSLHNRLVDRLRKNHRVVSLDQPVGFEERNTLADFLASPDSDITEKAAAAEIRERLFAALDHLNVKQRAIWIATEIEGYTFRELALRWDQPIGTLLARKHRATEALKDALQDIKLN